MSKFCTNCGTRLNEEDLFCGSCGNKIKSQLDAPESTISPVSLEQTNNDTSPNTTDNNQNAITKPVTPSKKKRTSNVIIICSILLIVAVCSTLFYFFITNAPSIKPEPPFYGVNRGDSLEEVEEKLGPPDDFDGISNDYFYYDIKFLGKKGMIWIHFDYNYDKVDSISFKCYGSTGYYDEVVEYYMEKYGDPMSQWSDNDLYGVGSTWKLDDGNKITIQFYPESTYSNNLSINLYR